MPSTSPELASPETAERVLRWLVRHSRNGMVAAAVRDIEVDLVMGRSTAGRALARLIRDGRITVARRGTGHLYPTVYVVGSVD